MAKLKKGTVPRTQEAWADLEARVKNPGEGYPLLSLRHLQPGFGVDELDPEAAHALLSKWAKRSCLQWSELRTHDRHGLGAEKLPCDKIKPIIPTRFKNDHYLVYRHLENHAVVGFLAADVFYVLWIEKEYGDLYDHGS